MNFFREPLFHFLLLGAGLFILSGLLNKSEGETDHLIVVSPGKVEHLVTVFSRTRQRPPTQQELEGLIEDYIKEEVWYREAQAIGLDRDDTVIRRRLRQKMEFLSEDIGDVAEPTEAELQAYLEEHAATFRIGSKISFTHVYLNADRRGGDVEDDAEELRLRLSADPALIQDPAIGDPFPFPRDFELLSESQVANLFGKDFAARLFTLEPGTWAGPVQSGYGQHLVVVRKRAEGRTPALAEIRDRVKRAYQVMTRLNAKEEFFKRLRDRYTVSVEYPEEMRTADRVSPAEKR